jgi:hypothetical protein
MENILYLTFNGLCNYKYTSNDFKYKIGNEFLLYLKTEKTFQINNLKWKTFGNCKNFKQFINKHCDKKDYESVVVIYACSLFCKYVGSNFTLGPLCDFGTILELCITGQAELTQINTFLSEKWTSLINVIFSNTDIVVAYKEKIQYDDKRYSDDNPTHQSGGFDDEIDEDERIVSMQTKEKLIEDNSVLLTTPFTQEQPKLNIMFVDSIDSMSQLSSSNILLARKIIIFGDGSQIDSINIVNNIHKSSKEVKLVAKGGFENTINSYLLSFNYVKRQMSDITFIVKQNELINYLENSFNTKDFDYDKKSNSIIFGFDNKTYDKLEFHFWFN